TRSSRCSWATRWSRAASSSRSTPSTCRTWTSRPAAQEPAGRRHIMPRTAFVALGTHLPDRVVTNEELTTRMETTDAWIRERTGIRERRWVREGTENSDLALEATRKALAKAKWEAKDIEAI